MRLLVAGAGTVLLFVSVIVHELGHVVMARRRRVAVGGISVFLLGGYSEIELDDMPPSVEIAVAVAGSVASVFLALILGGVAVALPRRWRSGARRQRVDARERRGRGLQPVARPPARRRTRRAGMLRSIGWSGQRAERTAAFLGIGVGASLTALGLVASWAGRPVSLVIAPAGLLLLFLCVTMRPAPESRVRDVMRPVGEPVSELVLVSALVSDGVPAPVVSGTAWWVSSGRGDQVWPARPCDRLARLTSCPPTPESVKSGSDWSRGVLLVVDKGRLVGVIRPVDVDPDGGAMGRGARAVLGARLFPEGEGLGARGDGPRVWNEPRKKHRPDS